MSDGAKMEPESSEGTALPHSAELQRRLAFLELTLEDRERLRQIAPKLSESAGEFVKAFYAHLLSFTDTNRFLANPELVERLKMAQQAHLESMLQAEWNDDYVACRRHVGDVHAVVGISPEIFLAPTCNTSNTAFH